MNLTRQTITAGGWVMGHKFLARFAGIFKTIILARILTPNEFGVFGLTTIALGMLETFSETGIDQALIQQKQVTDEHLSSAWMINLLRGTSLFILLYLTAPLISQFFGNPTIIIYIRVIALSPIIKSLKNPAVILLQRQLNFRREFMLRSVGTIAEVTLGIIVSLYTRNAWGLVISILAGVLGETMTSYLIIRPPAKFVPTKQAAMKLLNFGRWLWGSSILSYIATQGDNIAVGKLLGAVDLGFYQNAYKIATLPSTQITSVVTEVTYPALSQINQDHPRLIRAFKKTFIANLSVSLISSFAIILLAKPLTLILFGPNWLPLVPSLRILSLYGAIKAVSTVVGPLFKAVGKPHIITTYGMLFVLTMLIGIIPMTRAYGIEGTSWTVVIAALITQPYLIIHTLRLLQPNYDESA